MDPEDPGRGADGRDRGRPGQGTTPDATPTDAAQPTPTPPDLPPDAAPPQATPSSPAPGAAAGRAGDGDQDRADGAPGTAVPLLSLRGAAKSFGAVHAIVDASIDLYGGEVHALVGENGAGKSTLVKILAGVHRPDSGQLLVNGTPTVLHGPAAAQDAGIAVIYQEPTLFPDLTAAENIFMGRQPLRRGRRIDARRMRAQARALFERLGVRLDPGRICRGLSIADQQIIEIAKALSLEARIIVMDEPTAALSAAEVARLFDVAATLRASGAAVLFISHRLEEVFEICQRVTVMRDSRRVLGSKLAGLTADDLVRAMVGRQLDDRAADGHHTPGDVVLRVERLTREGVFTDVSFDVRAGEIVAFACVVVADRDGPAAGNVAAEIGSRDVAVDVTVDVTDEDAVAAAVAEAALAFGGIDLVVNNAGLSISRPLLETTAADWDLQHDVMARGSFLISREAARVMAEQGMGGDIVYICSKNSVVAGPDNVGYGAAKADQAHQVRLLAAELGALGIRVNGINPDGVVRGSGIFAGGWGAQRAAVYGVPESELGAFYARRTLLKREVLPEHVAAAVAALTSGDLPLTTGLHIPVDGGVTAAFLR